jgi:uncharacterized protein
MPTSPTYPGVYIEEVPSGVRTITGVATSVTAFIGRALRGPINEPTRVNSFADYERTFGGLWVESMMSYAVRGFFINGGSQALIVRLVADDASPARIAVATEGSPGEDLIFEASDAGTWANTLSVEVQYIGTTPRTSPPTFEPESFNLVIKDRDPEIEGSEVEVEKYLNVSMNAEATRYLPRVLSQARSRLRIPASNPGSSRPQEGVYSLSDPSPPGSPSESGADGGDLEAQDYQGSEADKTGIHALEKADLFNLLCIPPAVRGGDTNLEVYSDALSYCERRRAMLIVDPPSAWGAAGAQAASTAEAGISDLNLTGNRARNAAIYFPRVRQSDPEREGQLDLFVPCGIIAGIMARTDTQRGVWKAPAGLDATLNGVQGLEVNLTDDENGTLNPLGINCLRSFPVNGRVVWGARTLRGADQAADEYKYVPVRRTALFIEESLYRGTQWVVFEPNDEPLWAQIRLNVGAFMQRLFRQGAFQGKTPAEAYLVKCDKETTTQADINLGIVNILVGFAPLKPAEFVIIKIQQLAGQIET